MVAEALAKYGIAADRLELELTESVLMEATQRHSEEFERLRRVGVRLAIDDSVPAILRSIICARFAPHETWRA